jgi:hypothetical protein
MNIRRIKYRVTLAVVALLVSNAQFAKAQTLPKTEIPPSTLESISTPDNLDTSIGKLTFTDGVPSGDTVKTLYDNLDRTRGVTVYLDNLGAVAIRAFLSSLAAQGADAPNHVAIFEQLMDSQYFHALRLFPHRPGKRWPDRYRDTPGYARLSGRRLGAVRR